MFLRDLPEKNAVKINSLYVPSSAIESNCLRFTRPALMFEELAPGYPGMAGSATLVRHSGKNYALVTRHQFEFDSCAFEDSLGGLTIGSMQDRLMNIGFEKCYFPDAPKNDFHQLTALEIKDQTNFNPEYFNHINTLDLRRDDRERLFSFMVGYSNEGERILYEHNDSGGPHVILNPIVTKCKWVPEYKTSEQFMRTYKLENKIGIGTNGCSGGSVFSVMVKGSEFELVLDGIIIRGGNKIIHAVGSELLFDFL